MPRLTVAKTAKMLVNGQFVRSESGRTFEAQNGLGQACLASRKDVRDAVRAARSAQPAWAARTPVNRGQVLYRLAEMLEARASGFAELISRESGLTKPRAKREVEAAVDRAVHYAGWCDKAAQVLGSVNPVSGPFFDFSVVEPIGVVAVLAPSASPLVGLVSLCLPPLAVGSTVVAVAASPMVATEFAEVVATSDLPPGSLNLLTGVKGDLAKTLVEHRDVDAIADADGDDDFRRVLVSGAADSLKRVRVWGPFDLAAWHSPSTQGLDWVEAFVEVKTVWHPVGM